MDFRKAQESDIDRIMEIISEAQSYFKQNGIDQWQNNYPNHSTIKNDVVNQNSYVLRKDRKVVATATIIFDGEPTYKKIYNGKWLTSHSNYADSG